MRSLYLAPNHPFWSDEQKVYSGEKLHHLVKVIRIKQNEKLVIFDGEDRCIVYEISSIGSRKICLEEIQVFSYQAPHQLSVAIAMTKKDSLEQSLKIATECGACKIYFFHSQYSYNEKSWEWKDRHYKIIEGAMEQANVFRYPELIGPIDLKELLELPLHFITMSSQGAERVRTSQYQDSVLLIGPEGGWSPQELKSFHDNKITSIQLNLPILRTPTAIAASLGHIVTSHFE